MTSYAQIKGRTGKNKSKLIKGLNGSSFTAQRHDVTTSPEIMALGLAAKWVFFRLSSKYNRKNNGDLSAPLNKAKEEFNLTGQSLKNALDELIAAGFLEITRQGGKNQCSLYALTCFPLNDVNKAGIALKATDRPSDKWKKSQ